MLGDHFLLSVDLYGAPQLQEAFDKIFTLHKS